MTYVPEPSTVISRRVEQRGNTGIRYVATGEQTGHDFGLFEYELPARSDGASPHLHRTFSESFYVLEGRLDVLGGEQWTTVGAGDLVHVPRGCAHGFRNPHGDDARFLLLFSPGLVPRQDYFDAVRERRRTGTVLSAEEQDAFAEQFDQYNLR